MRAVGYELVDDLRIALLVVIGLRLASVWIRVLHAVNLVTTSPVFAALDRALARGIRGRPNLENQLQLLRGETILVDHWNFWVEKRESGRPELWCEAHRIAAPGGAAAAAAAAAATAVSDIMDRAAESRCGGVGGADAGTASGPAAKAGTGAGAGAESSASGTPDATVVRDAMVARRNQLFAYFESEGAGRVDVSVLWICQSPLMEIARVCMSERGFLALKPPPPPPDRGVPIAQSVLARVVDSSEVIGSSARTHRAVMQRRFDVFAFWQDVGEALRDGTVASSMSAFSVRRSSL